MNFIERFVKNLIQADESTFIHEVHQDTFHEFSGRQIVTWAKQVQSIFASKSLKSRDRIALLAPNSAKWVACDIACLASGMVSIPLYSRQDPKELATILKDCLPSLLLVSDQQLKIDLLKQWSATCPVVTYDECFSGDTRLSPSEIGLVISPTEKGDSRVSPITIVYTSGTSGEPKGVMLSLDNLEFMLERTTGTLERAKKDKKQQTMYFISSPAVF